MLCQLVHDAAHTNTFEDCGSDLAWWSLQYTVNNTLPWSRWICCQGLKPHAHITQCIPAQVSFVIKVPATPTNVKENRTRILPSGCFAHIGHSALVSQSPFPPSRCECAPNWPLTNASFSPVHDVRVIDGEASGTGPASSRPCHSCANASESTVWKALEVFLQSKRMVVVSIIYTKFHKDLLNLGFSYWELYLQWRMFYSPNRTPF